MPFKPGRYRPQSAGHPSTLVATQIPRSRWHEQIGDPTYGDAILDRLVHNAYRIELSGRSMRELPSTGGKSNLDNDLNGDTSSTHTIQGDTPSTPKNNSKG
jgi:hypothetical protein